MLKPVSMPRTLFQRHSTFSLIQNGSPFRTNKKHSVTYGISIAFGH